MSDFRVEKRRVLVSVSLVTGACIEGCLFLAEQAAVHCGGERVSDLLNGSTDFFPFELAASDDSVVQMAVLNREHVLVVHLGASEVNAGPSVSPTSEKSINLQLSNGNWISGVVPVISPVGHDRLSDYARTHERFRHMCTDAGELIVNFAHVVQIRPLSE